MGTWWLQKEATKIATGGLVVLLLGFMVLGLGFVPGATRRRL